MIIFIAYWLKKSDITKPGPDIIFPKIVSNIMVRQQTHCFEINLMQKYNISWHERLAFIQILIVYIYLTFL